MASLDGGSWEVVIGKPSWNHKNRHKNWQNISAKGIPTLIKKGQKNFATLWRKSDLLFANRVCTFPIAKQKSKHFKNQKSWKFQKIFLKLTL